MNTLNLQGEQLELFNQIASLDNESFAKVKGMSKGLSTTTSEEKQKKRSIPSVMKKSKMQCALIHMRRNWKD